MSRNGFNPKIHPYQLQLRVSPFGDSQGLRNRSSITIDLQNGKIKEYNTDEEQISTTIREYAASDDELKELYDFLTIDTIEKFEALSDSDLRQYQTGYYDAAELRYFLIGGDGRISDGVRHHIYSVDPIAMSMDWLRRIVPFDLS